MRMSVVLKLQAICRDRLFPYINRFGRGHGVNDEPRQALFLALLIAIGMILIGNQIFFGLDSIFERKTIFKGI